MTDQLKELANECKERGIDFDDVSPNQGSTSCDKLVRHYIAAASPDDVLALIAEVERLKSQEPVAYVVSIGNSFISITFPVKHLDLLAKSHNAPLYLASGAAPTRPTTPEQQAEPTIWRDMVVVSLVREGINKHKARELADHFATPPQRTWVGLTDEEMQACWNDTMATPEYSREGIYRAIEAKLKERNT